MAKLIPITIPKWGIEMERGTISEWRVAPGASVVQGDELVDIETEKIVNSFEASSDGMLVRIIAQEGEELEVGTLIGVMASEAVSDEDIDAFIAAANSVSQTPLAAAEKALGEKPEAATGSPAFSTGQVRISPALRRKAQRLAIDVASIAGSGYGGRILRDDIEAARGAGNQSPFTQLSGAQKTIAERMTLAKQTIPHFYLQRDCEMDSAIASLESARAQSGVAITITHALVHAIAQALKKYPELNLNILANGVRTLDSVDVAIAVDTGDTLLTPVLRGIDDSTLAAVAQGATELVGRCRNKQLSQDDVGGGAITVSNLGMLGVTSFTAIINPPQVMILSVGTIQERVTLNEGKPEIMRFCALTLACDHRVINGAAGAKFLGAICEAMTGGS